MYFVGIKYCCVTILCFTQKNETVSSTSQIIDNSPQENDPKNYSIVHAAQFGLLCRVKELVEAGFDVNQMDAENVSILHWAAINNRADIVR